jgi:pimeloyl-ACP methyl ester carboxylesterase
MSKISFSVRGSGFPVILLHGFPFNQNIWSTFAEQLSPYGKIYTPDLPGLGKSEILSDKFSIQDVADALVAWAGIRGIERCTVIGHSLGGYVALAMARRQPSLCESFGLFHSTALPDSQEKKESRTKSVGFIEKNGAEAFTANFIEPLFIDHNNPAIPFVRDIAKQASAQAVIAYTLAMRDRPGHEELLKEFPRPILFLAGEKDQGIPVDSIHKQAALCQKPEIRTLKSSAHMGMFEEPKESLSVIGDFIARSSAR